MLQPSDESLQELILRVRKEYVAPPPAPIATRATTHNIGIVRHVIAYLSPAIEDKDATAE